MIALRAAVDVALRASGHRATSAYDWLRVMHIGIPQEAAARVITGRITDAAFIINQIEFDALVTQYAAEDAGERPEFRMAA